MSDRDEVDEVMVDEVVVQGKESWLAHSPWWLVSAGIHAVLLLGASLYAIDRLVDREETFGCPRIYPSPPPVIEEPLRPRDDIARKGIPKDEASFATDEPAIFFPEAKESDHNESADNEDYHQMKGKSKDFLSYTPGEAGGTGRQDSKVPGSNATLGTGKGGGGGGRYGGRFGGRENLVAKGGGTRATESAVIAALKWLAHHQGPDGGWGAESFQNQCSGGRCGGPGEKDYDTGVTALSVLAFLGAGYSHLSRDEFADPVQPGRVLRFGEVVKKGERWLIDHQDPEGCVGERGVKYMYNHAVGALALSEAYGMTASEPLRGPAQKAIEFLLAAQNPGKGWRYSSKSGDNDCSVTGWAVMALKSAELSDIHFPKTAYDGALAWFNEATETNGYYRTGYNARGTGTVFVPGKNEQFVDHPAMTAVSVMSRIFMQKRKGDPALGGVSLLAGDLPEWKEHKIDFYYWYYSSLALFQFDGPDGVMWKKWNEPMKNALVPHQHTTGCKNGSWDSDVDRWGVEGGRVFAVAINALTLEVYYRYANVIGGSRK